MIYLHPTITHVRWSGPATLDVTFVSSDTTRLHQLYVGRRMLSQSTSPTQRRLSASLIPARWAEFLTVAAVDAADIGQDRGSWLPRRPYNRVLVIFDQTGWTGDPHALDVLKFELFRGDTPEGAVNYNSVIDSILSRPGNPGYQLESDPLPGPGLWNLAVRGLDATVESGNAGTATASTAVVLATPPDFAVPFAVSVNAGIATITTTIPAD